jgi:hypothetical protein
MTDDQRTQAVDAVLSSLVGQWHGVAQTWFEPTVLADEAPIQGTIRRIGASHFVLHEYASSFQGQPLSGVALYGYNQNVDSFESAWVDSFHMSTNIMHSSGTAGASDLNVSGSYAAESGPPWGWRTTLAAVGADRLMITAYNRSPEGQETKAVEITYTRADQA